MLLGWQSLAAHIARRDDVAADTSEQALRFITDQTPAADRLFVEAVAAETRRDPATAEERYRARAERRPDDSLAMMQLAAFQDRANHNTDAIASYLAVLARDARLARPNVELCRMYNRLNEFAKAKEFAQKALAAYQAIGARNGEGQSLFCLADALRGGSDTDREVASGHAERATQIFTDLGAQYNLARGYNYQALIAGLRGRRVDAAKYGEQALAAARRAGNTVLQPLVLMNLGVTVEALGDRVRAAEYYQQSSAAYERLGDQARAAQNQANGGALRIVFGPNPDEGLREIQNALAVARTLGDKDFESFCLKEIATYFLNAGRIGEADRSFNQMLAVARERDLADKIAAANIGRARVRITSGDYATARDLLVEVLRRPSGATNTLEANVHLARVDVRLGQFDAARDDLVRAKGAVEGADTSVLPLLHLVAGELEYEQGHLPVARTEWQQAAALWTDDAPDQASVEARAHLGLLDVLNGDTAGRLKLQVSLEHAHGMGLFPLEAFCRVLLARIAVNERKFEEGLTALKPIPPDSEQRALGAELRAHVHYLRMQAFDGQGDRANADLERQAARQSLDALRSSLPAQYRSPFTRRPEIQRIIG
jgi:tetratricopeptide (TPR) repeat protein